MSGLPCGAAEFRRAGGPSAVPFHACCAAALVAGIDDMRSPFPCAAELIAALATDGRPDADSGLAAVGMAVGGGPDRPA